MLPPMVGTWNSNTSLGSGKRKFPFFIILQDFYGQIPAFGNFRSKEQKLLKNDRKNSGKQPKFGHCPVS